MKKILSFPLSLFLWIAFFSATGFAAENKTVLAGKKTDQGFEIAKGSYLDVPEDMKIKQVANNVIRHESTQAYVARRLNALDERLLQLEQTLDTRLRRIEEHLGIPKTATEAKTHG